MPQGRQEEMHLQEEGQARGAALGAAAHGTSTSSVVVSPLSAGPEPWERLARRRSISGCSRRCGTFDVLAQCLACSRPPSRRLITITGMASDGVQVVGRGVRICRAPAKSSASRCVSAHSPRTPGPPAHPRSQTSLAA